MLMVSSHPSRLRLLGLLDQGKECDWVGNGYPRFRASQSFLATLFFCHIGRVDRPFGEGRMTRHSCLLTFVSVLGLLPAIGLLSIVKLAVAADRSVHNDPQIARG